MVSGNISQRGTANKTTAKTSENGVFFYEKNTNKTIGNVRLVATVLFDKLFVKIENTYGNCCTVHPVKTVVQNGLPATIVTFCFPFTIIAFSIVSVHCATINKKHNRLFVLNDYKERQRQSAVVAKTIYNITFGVIILLVGVVMLLLNKINNATLNEYLGYLDPLLRYMFGGLCLLYGGWRLYRGIKKEF